MKTPPTAVRRLAPKDHTVLTFLAEHDAEYDLDGRGEPLAPLSREKAEAFLADPTVLFWIAEQGDQVAGFLFCVHHLIRSGDGHELLLFEIGVHKDFRRRGVGRALNDAMELWMRDNAVKTVWVPGDNRVAVEFYSAIGFAADAEDSDIPAHKGAVFMVKELGR